MIGGILSGKLKVAFATFVVGTLVASTVVTMVAAQGTASVTVHVQYDGPRTVSAAQVKARLVTVEASGKAGYAYGYQFLNWLQTGYGYADFNFQAFESGTGFTIQFSSVAVGEYRIQVWLDLDGDGEPDEEVEPIAFAEEKPDDDIINLLLGESKTAYAVIGEKGASLTGSVQDNLGAALKDAQVTLTGPFGDKYGPVATSSLGAFSISNVPTGLWYAVPYTVTATKTDHTTATTTANLPKEGLALSNPLVLTSTLVGCPNVCIDGSSLVRTLKPETEPHSSLTISGSAEIGAAGDYFFSVALASATDQASATRSSAIAFYPKGTATFSVTIPADDIVAAGVEPAKATVKGYSASGTLHDTDVLTFAAVPIGSFLGPAIDLKDPDVTVTKETSDGDQLFEIVKVVATFTVDRAVSAFFVAEARGAGGAFIPGASKASSVVSYAKGTSSVTLLIDGSVIAREKVDPRQIVLTAFTSESSTIDSVTKAFDGGAASDYQVPPVTFDSTTLSYATTDPDTDGKINTFDVTATPTVAVARELRFAMTLLTADGQVLASKTFDLASYTAGTKTLTHTFQGTDLNLALPGVTDYDFTRIRLVAYDTQWAVLATVEKAVDPKLNRGSFETGLAPLTLPDPASTDVHVTCDGVVVGGGCDSNNRPDVGFGQLNLRMNVSVNDQGSFAYEGDVRNLGNGILAKDFLPLSPYAPGKRLVELHFRGTDISKKGVDGGLGDPVSIRVDALDAFYKSLGILTKDVSTLKSVDFESVGVALTMGTETVTGNNFRFPVAVSYSPNRLGTYKLTGNLFTEDFKVVASTSAIVTLPSGQSAAAANLDFDARLVFTHMDVHGKASQKFLVSATLVEVGQTVPLVTAKRLTDAYAKTQFPPPPLRFGTGALAVGTDPDDNGYLDSLQVSLPLVGQPDLESSNYKVGISIRGLNRAFVTGRVATFPVTPAITSVPATVGTFDGTIFSSRGINGPYTVDVFLVDPSGRVVSALFLTTGSLLASNFESTGIRIPGLTETGIAGPTGAPWLYDGMRVTASLAVGPGGSGTYDVLTTVYRSDWVAVSSSFTTGVAIDDGTTSKSFSVPGEPIRGSTLDGTVRYVVLFYKAGTKTLVASADGQSTATYKAGEFLPAGVLLGDPSGFTDERALSNSVLRLTASYTVGKEGTYTFRADLYGSAKQWIGARTTTVTHASGDAGKAASATIDFDAIDLLASGNEGPYTATFSVRDAAGAVIAAPETPKTTKAYPFSGWNVEAPLKVASLPGETSTLKDGLVDKLHQEIAYNVNSPGTYTLVGNLILQTGGKVIILASASKELTDEKVGTGKRTTLDFTGSQVSKTFPDGVTSALSVKVTAYRGTSGRGQIVDEATRATSQTYTKGGFTPPPSAATITAVAWSGVDSNADGKLEAIEVVIDVTITEKGLYIATGDLSSPDGKKILSPGGFSYGTLEPGERKLKLSFPAKSIVKNGKSKTGTDIDGTYKIPVLAISLKAGATRSVVASVKDVVSPVEWKVSQFVGVS